MILEIFFLKKEIVNMQFFSDENLSERLRSGYNHNHGMHYTGKLKLTYNYGRELITISEEDLLQSGILEFEEEYDRTPKEPYLEAGRYYLGSEKWSYELAKCNDFDIRRLKLIVGKSTILNKQINILSNVRYENKEVELEIDDSGVDCYFKGVKLLDKKGIGVVTTASP